MRRIILYRISEPEIFLLKPRVEFQVFDPDTVD